MAFNSEMNNIFSTNSEVADRIVGMMASVEYSSATNDLASLKSEEWCPESTGVTFYIYKLTKSNF